MTKNFVDSRELSDELVVDTDVCVVGAGAAGITISQEFANLSFKVCLLESGGLNFEQHIQSQGELEIAGRPYPDANACRLRYFGGTTNHWGGHCVPLEPIDFEKRSWIPYSGWPITYEEILPYYLRAIDVLQLGEFNYDAQLIAKSEGLQLLTFGPNTMANVVSRYNRIRFGVQFYETLSSADNIHVYLYASVSKLILNDAFSSVRQLVVTVPNGERIRFRARYVVLAAGGIENPVLLLASRDQQRNGVGNDFDLVGRFFMDHLWYPSGVFLTPSNSPGYKAYVDRSLNVNGVQIRFHLAVPGETTRALQIPRFRSEIKLVSEVEHAVHRIFRRGKKWSPDLTQALGDLVSHPLSVVSRIFDKDPAPLIYLLNNYVEQTPNFNSRISLSTKVNSLGNPLPKMDWQLSPIDKEGIVKSHQLIAKELGRTGQGRFRYELGEDDGMLLEGVFGGCHHMGTTRMSEYPRDGVVDKNGKVHGIDNLYLAGSSVFPCVGWANPTMTIVALSLRLADHLRARIAKGR